jgi:hypothetical protein
MTKHERSWRRVVGRRLMGAAFMIGASALAPSCADQVVVQEAPTPSVLAPWMQTSVDKIDVLLVIDNSRSMADKQEILKLAVPDLVRQLVNPQCLLEDGTPAGQQPTDPLADCPVDGSAREFDPILNFHLGIVTSSLGGHGADACNAMNIPSENDKARLISRSGTGANDPVVEGWNGNSFLVWDPSAENPTHSPQGETDVDTLIANMATMVGGAGEIGCGYEGTLEAWYRFLVEPDPHQDVTIEGSSAVLGGTDSTLLAQRADFLRPDSLLAIIMLSDENDCSIRDGSSFYFAAQIHAPGTNEPFHLPRPRAACSEDVTSTNFQECCKSCGQSACAEKDGDGNCVRECDTSQDDCDSGPLDNFADNISLRCWDQRRRFGIDFLWPIERYVTGVTAQQVQDRHGNIVPNPLFSDLNPKDDNNALRDAGLVFVAGIVGVPWQDIARKNSSGQPDLLAGLNRAGEPIGGFQSADELDINGTWDVILGNPVAGIPPTDPLMLEGPEPRTGTNPVTGDPLQPPGSGPVNPINGSEYSIPNRGDLQYACIFPLVDVNLMPVSRDCTDPNETACDCSDPANDNPLCDPNLRTDQESAKAYPGIRELSLLKGVGQQGIVGSICPAQLIDLGPANFGYRPAINAIVERLKQAIDAQCLPRSLTPNEQGRVPCLIVEALTLGDPARCNATCSAPGRKPIAQDHPAVEAAQTDPLAAAAGYNCFCEIPQTAGEDLVACQISLDDNPINQSGNPVHGWCYVDATTVPPTGNPEIVAACPDTEQRIIRFVGNGHSTAGATLFISCSAD